MPTLAMTPEGVRSLDVNELLAQIGTRNVLAISGGRVGALLDADGVVVGIRLPVAAGYSVEVWLHASDTYIIRRVFTRGSKAWVKGERTDVYCEEVGETAYRASCYLDEWEA